MKSSPSNFTVAIYMIDQSYGGPEEGGWWYTTGYPDDDFSRFTRGFRTRKAASIYRHRLDRHLISKLNKGRRPLSSVLSNGVYDARITEGNPKSFPSSRPYYE